MQASSIAPVFLGAIVGAWAATEPALWDTLPSTIVVFSIVIVWFTTFDLGEKCFREGDIRGGAFLSLFLAGGLVIIGFLLHRVLGETGNIVVPLAGFAFLPLYRLVQAGLATIDRLPTTRTGVDLEG